MKSEDGLGVSKVTRPRLRAILVFHQIAVVSLPEPGNCHHATHLFQSVTRLVDRMVEVNVLLLALLPPDFGITLNRHPLTAIFVNERPADGSAQPK